MPLLGRLFSPLESRHPFPPWFLPSFLLTGSATCLIPSKHRWLRVAVGAPIFASLLLNAPAFTAGEVATDFVTGIFMTGAVIKWLDFALFHDTEKSFWRVADLRPRWQSGEKQKERQDVIEKSLTESAANQVNGVSVDDTDGFDAGYTVAYTTSASSVKQFSDDYARGASNGHIYRYARNPATADNSIEDAQNERETFEVNGKVRSSDIDYHDNAPLSPNASGSWFERLCWNVDLWTTTRGVGWNWKVSNVPESVSPGYPRLKFLRYTLYRFLYHYTALDFVHACTNWYTRTKGNELPNVFAESWPIRTIVSWLAAFETFNALQWPFYLAATITTALGICQPEQWPNLMGSFSKDMWSVRQFWGKCWHGHARRIVVKPAEVVVDLLGLPRGSLVRKYVQLYLSFSISALTHHAGAWMVGRDSAGMWYLWLGQATIIMLEDMVIYYGKRHGIKDSSFLRVLGHIWVCLWFCLPTNFPIGAAVVINRGMGYDPAPLGLSPSAAFPIASKCNNSLWKVIADRGLVFFLISKTLDIVQAEDMRTVLEGTTSCAGALLLRYSRL